MAPQTTIRGAAVAAVLLTASLVGAPVVAAQTPATTEAAVRDAAAVADGPRLEALRERTGDEGLNALIRSWLAAAALDEDAAVAAFDAYRRSSAATPELTALGRSIIAGSQFASGDYREAAEAAAAWEQGLGADSGPEEALSASQTRSVATLLARAEPQRMDPSRPEPVPTAIDAAGLVRAPMTVNGWEISAVLDTGANLSVLSVSAAERLGVTVLEGSGSVGSTTQDAVPVRLGVADTLVIGGATLRNVAFLIIDDSALSFPLPGGYTIEAIIGFPVFRALGRTTFTKDGWFTWSTEARDPMPANVYVRGSNLHVVVEIGAERLPLHLDTGAGGSDLSSAAFPRLAPHGFQRTEVRRTAGAGGSKDSAVRILAPLTMMIDDQSLCHAALPLEPEDAAGADSLGTLGQDILGAFDSYTLDLDHMTFELGAPAGGRDDVTPGACADITGRPGG